MSAFATASTFNRAFDFDSVHVFAWPLMEEVVYAILQRQVGSATYTINEDKSKDIDLSQVPEATKTILLVGSHWDILSIKKAKDVGKSVKMITWSGDGSQGSEMDQYIDEGMVYLDWTDSKSSFNWKYCE